ncbi:MAG TPA: tetratricopeptide repeat protein [Kofleriaceae bacterium]|nr:tetratricopeptide repeat protein [Kofleriaceae bacterium]
MDVRCEKCQTEYELDEARLKPGGVTVKCTNCGHMFKIRKRTSTAAGGTPVPPAGEPQRTRPMSPRPPQAAIGSRADSIMDEMPTRLADESPTAVDRQWLIRLENGEQRSCRELATLQQWIVSGIVGREGLISRTGKTWKRLGDIGELAQYFDIADEARTTRAKSTSQQPRGTMLGVGPGGGLLPDDEEARTTGNYRAMQRAASTPPPPAKVPTKTPPLGSNASVGTAPTLASTSGPLAAPAPVPAPAPVAAPAPVPASAAALPTRRPNTTPPPPPAKKPTSPPGERRGPSVPAPVGNRATAVWATEGADKVAGSALPQSGPFVGKLSAIPDEPAFAGRVRGIPSEEASYETGRVRMLDEDDDDLLPGRRGSRAGLWILLGVLVVGGIAATLVYVLVLSKPDEQKVATTPADAQVAVAPDAAAIVTPVIDAPEAPPLSPVEQARAELPADNETRLRTALETLAGKDDPDALAVRANLEVAIAQSLADRAGLVAEKAEADKLRKEAKTLTLDAATLAQKAHKAAADSPAANLAMAGVLRLQGKPARDIKRYVDAAKGKPAPEWTRDVALADALVLRRDTKLDDAKAALATIDQGDGKLETSNDVRARFQLALIALAQNRVADAKTMVDQILAAQPEHLGAKALAAKLETKVAATDPLPPEDNGKGSGSATTKPPNPNPNPDVSVSGTDTYDGWLKKANALADKNCTKALELYAKALEQKPNGVEALTGMGYCHLDAKNFASAHSRFRTALATSPRYEPALAGIAEAYQQQGRKDDAIAAWRTYLEAYPGSAKAQRALERLGAGDGGGAPTPPNNAGSGGSTPTPTPPPPSEGGGPGSG